MENLRSRINVQLVNNEKDYLKCTSIDNNLVAIRSRKLALKRNKPAYIGICVLQLSEVLMYKFHYDYIKNKYDNKSKLLFTEFNILN